MSRHSIEITTKDGHQVSFECPEDTNVIAAADAAGIGLPSMCREGGCGACRGTCASGDYQLASHNPAALPEHAEARREVLLCRTFPRTDLSIHVPFDHGQIVFGAAPFPRRAEIVSCLEVADHTRHLVLRLQPDEVLGSAAQFEPGQFVELEFSDAGIRRAYSPANSPNWDGVLEFYIRLQPGGAFSSLLAEAQEGDTLLVHGPTGGFCLQERGLAPRWFVAGGTGFAPLLSMLRRMAEWQHPQFARLYFGANHESELFALEELRQLGEELPGFKVELCLRSPGREWQGFVGTPVDALSRDLEREKAFPDLYLCGPPAMIDAAETAAEAYGLAVDQVFSERFLPGAA